MEWSLAFLKCCVAGATPGRTRTFTGPSAFTDEVSTKEYKPSVESLKAQVVQAEQRDRAKRGFKGIQGKPPLFSDGCSPPPKKARPDKAKDLFDGPPSSAATIGEAQVSLSHGQDLDEDNLELQARITASMGTPGCNSLDLPQSSSYGHAAVGTGVPATPAQTISVPAGCQSPAISLEEITPWQPSPEDDPEFKEAIKRSLLDHGSTSLMGVKLESPCTPPRATLMATIDLLTPPSGNDQGNICSPSARGISPTAPYNSPGDLTNSVEALEEELEALIDAGVRAEAESGEEEENPQDDDLYD